MHQRAHREFGQRFDLPGAGVKGLPAVARTSGARVIDGIPQYADKELHGGPPFDVAIDFSLPQGLEAALALCVERGAALGF